MNKKDLFVFLGFALSLIFSFGSFFFSNLANFIVSSLSLIFFMVFYLKCRISNNGLKFSSFEFFIFLLFVFTSIFIFLFSYNKPLSLFVLWNLFITYLVGFFFYHSKFTSLLSVVKVAYVLYLLLIFLNLESLAVGVNGINVIIDGASRNVVSGIAIYLFVFICLLSERAEAKINYFYPASLLSIALLANSRTALILSFVLTVMVFIYNTRNYRIRKLAFFCALLLVGLTTLSTEVWYSYLSGTRLSEGLQSIRYEMWREYIQSIDFESFFIGVNLDRLPLISSFNNNPHNSYIYAHSMFGFAAFIWFLFLSFSVLYSFIVGRYFIGSLMLIIVVRAAFDIGFFLGKFDFVLFTTLLYLYQPHDSGCKEA
ncbi:hypothetical protein SAMN04488070_1135 [Pseudidiomarina maritima]|uniref:O-antigen ligase-related domain-containing protein n=1 Tax=Pseudidiomarina maritima TaxID=519453 RepID=A0A1I6GRV0_9GAMM|nr:O-antigen ligase family protein [Pseudidiomarina maritima]SFR44908.1 hypothetical protein SAMN04488070_1135 [Pseudidiomarina maritima]